MTGQSTVPWFPHCRVPPMRLPMLALQSRALATVSAARPSSRACPTRRSCPHDGVDEGLLCCSTERLLCWPSPTTSNPLVGGLVSNIRGTSMKNFRARISCFTLPAARASAASLKLRRSAVLKAPLMTFGTTRIKQPLLLNSVSKMTWSKLQNPLAMAARATSTRIGAMSSWGGSSVLASSASHLLARNPIEIVVNFFATVAVCKRVDGMELDAVCV